MVENTLVVAPFESKNSTSKLVLSYYKTIVPSVPTGKSLKFAVNLTTLNSFISILSLNFL